jgi:peptidoglycan/LPS O-acetylase OafA/YrhL
LLRESERNDDISIRNFYVRRVLRLFPAFYFFWLLDFAICYFTGKLSASAVTDYAAAFFYLRNYRSAASPHPHQRLGHTWALSLEEQFYLLWPWLLGFFQKDLRRLSRLLIALIVAVDLYRMVLFFGFHVSRQWLTFSFDCRVDHLLVGCLLAVLLKRGVLHKFWTFIISRTWFSLVTFSLVVGSIALDTHYGNAYTYAVGFVIDPLLTAVLLVQVIVFAHTWAWGWLNWKVTQYIGRISYSMFLYQWIANSLAFALVGHRVRFSVIVAVPLTILFGSISYYAIELRFLKLKSRFISRPATTLEHESKASYAGAAV